MGTCLIIGGGVVGTQAAKMALGLGADVTILDRSLPRLRELDVEFGGRLKAVYSTADVIEQLALEADLVIMDAPMGSVGEDTLADIEAGDVPAVSMVLVDGEIVVAGSRNTPPPVRKPEVK